MSCNWKEWQQIDMQRRVAWIHPDQTKAAKAIGVPLNDDAVTVLEAQIGKHHSHVFTYKGKPVAKAGTQAWQHYNALTLNCLDGMIYAIRGQAGMYKMERHYIF